MRRCEDEKMRYRPPLLEEPCAQTLSGITKNGFFVVYRAKRLRPTRLVVQKLLSSYLGEIYIWFCDMGVQGLHARSL